VALQPALHFARPFAPLPACLSLWWRGNGGRLFRGLYQHTHQLLIVVHITLPLYLVHAFVQSRLRWSSLQHEEARVGFVPRPQSAFSNPPVASKV
jgi:hypothetical protein